MYILLTAVTISVIYLLYRWNHPPTVCPQCDSKQVTQINRDVSDVVAVDIHDGSPGGGGQQLMSTIKETYHCRECYHQWTETRREI